MFYLFRFSILLLNYDVLGFFFFLLFPFFIVVWPHMLYTEINIVAVNYTWDLEFDKIMLNRLVTEAPSFDGL